MFDTALMRSVQTYEFIKMNGWSSFLREAIYRDRRAFIFEKDLGEIKDPGDALARSGAEMIQVTREDVAQKKYCYRFRNRYLKALHYLDKGYGGFGAVKENEVVGEMWYCRDSSGEGGQRHRDLPWLGLTLAPDEVYAFDWFVIPQQRGANLAGLFQNSALHSLHIKGFTKAYAYVWADNTPALWTTRSIMKWKEIRAEKMNRFLISRTH